MVFGVNFAGKVFVFSVVVIFTIFLFYRVDAMIGVSPAYYDVDFQPDLKRVFNFEFFSDEDYPIELYTSGELARYAELSRDKINNRGGGVSVSVELPSELETPGINSIVVGGRQVPTEEQGFGIVGDMRGLIRIKVPYPGKYASVNFNVKNVKAGEPVEFKVEINNLGKESIDMSTIVIVYDSFNMTVETMNLADSHLEPTKGKVLLGYMNTTAEQAGLYTARVIVNYGGKSPAVSESKFRLGELYMEILNYTEEFKRNSINRFEVEVESFWNDPIENVYAEVLVPVYNIRFLTPSLSFSGFEKRVFTGYFDTAGISEDVDEFKAKIMIHYQGKTSERVVSMRFKKETDYLMYALIVGIVIAIGVLVWLYIWIRKIKNEARRGRNAFKEKSRR